MKFKKVEIQGFRAYGNKEDATFDFTTNNEVVDLVSLYAPNGFGKTSFYDAIEWAVTNKIKRFERALENYDLIKTEKDANRKGNQQSDALHIISKIGYDNPEKFISIETTTTPFNKVIKSNIRKGSVDYDRNATLDNSNFRDVILSQEGINSFLVAEKPEDRYKNFVQHFDSNDLDRLYGNLAALRKENEKRFKSLESDKTEINKQLNEKIDKEVSKKINKLISELSILEIKLKKISQEFDLSDLAIFKSEITGAKNEIELGESSIIEKLKREQKFLAEAQQNIPKHIDNLEQKKKVLKLIDNISKVIKDFGELNKKNNRKDTLQESLKKGKKRRDDFIFISKKFPEFKRASERLEHVKNNQKKKKDYLIKLDDLEILINLNASTFENRKQALEKKIGRIEKDLNTNQSNLKNYKNSLEKNSSLETKLKIEKDKLKGKNSVLNTLNKEIEELLLIEKNLKSGIYKQKNSTQISEDSINKLNKVKSLISNKEKEISLIKKKLNDSKSLQENLSYLIELGKKIVDKTEQSNCPLCKNEYGDYKNLLEKINLNDSLEESSKENTDKLIQFESELKNLKQELEKHTDDLNSTLSVKIEKLHLKINRSLNTTLSLEKDIASLEKKLERHRSVTKNHEKEYQKVDLEKILFEMQQEIEMHKNKINIYEKIIKKYALWIEGVKEKKSISNIDVHDLDKDLKSLLNDSDYKNYNNLLNVYGIDSIEQEMEVMLGNSKKKLDNLEKEISNLDQEINTLKGNLKEFKIEESKEQESEYKKDLLRLNTLESEFSDLVKYFNITQKNLREGLKLKITSNKAAIEKNEEALRVLSRIERLVEPLGDFLNYNELKGKEKDLDAKIKLNKKINRDLKNELEKISDRINLMIKNFFFDDLINKIYAKIDPHPQYKKINFSVDFNDYGLPKLSIFTEDDKKSGKRVPNLYFSTAQMNVLSLSIFLAKALHAVDEKGDPIDTIFIDDPVQSMDSINVLSVIDLLRNIIINHNKQIIISTHDENFFNLLKKKIPKKYFKSKFLELETFGKLKPDNNYSSISNIVIDKSKRDNGDNLLMT